MADLTISTITVPNSQGDGSYTAGEAIAAGEVVYFDETTGKVFLAKCDDANRIGAIGFAVNTAAINQSVAVNASQVMTVNSAAISTLYFLSTTAGKIFLESDLSSTNYKVIMAIGSLVTALTPRIWGTGIQKP